MRCRSADKDLSGVLRVLCKRKRWVANQATGKGPYRIAYNLLGPCLVRVLADHVGVTWINTQWWTLNNMRIHVGINPLRHSPTAADLF